MTRRRIVPAAIAILVALGLWWFDHAQKRSTRRCRPPPVTRRRTIKSDRMIDRSPVKTAPMPSLSAVYDETDGVTIDTLLTQAQSHGRPRCPMTWLTTPQR